MIFYFHPEYVAETPRRNGFSLSKYAATRDALSALGVTFEKPEPASRARLMRAHEKSYVDAVLNANVPPEIERRIGFPVTPEISRRSLRSVGGTLAAAFTALDSGFAANLAGGSHHAMPDSGAGYCVLNDLAVAAATLLAEGHVSRLLVLDLDVHQGDGTAVCLQGISGAYSFSMHAAHNYPARKARSSRDVELPDGMEDADYLQILADELPALFDTARPEILLVQAGVDPHKEDKLGRLALSDEGLLARESLVREACLKAGLPFAVTMGGGYDDDIVRLGQRHARTLLAYAGRSVTKS